MKKFLTCLLLTLAITLCAVPMLATSTSAEEGVPTGGASLLTPDDIYVPEQNQYDRLYVQDGLTVLLTAYDHTDKNVSLVNGNGTWQNKIADENGEYKKFSIVGQNLSFAFTDVDGVIHEGNTAWRKIEGGGIGYEATLKQMQNGLNSYVDIGIDNLPQSHTVEMIFDPYGAYLDGTESYLSDSNMAEDWSYIVTAGNIGVYSKHTIAKNAGVSIAPHHTFYVGYQQDGIWGQTDTQSVGSFSDMSLDTRGVVNLTIVREEGGIFVRTGYKVYDCESTLVRQIHTLAVLSSRGSEFKVMRETPGVLYAVRVYDRALTDAERAQNHFADVCNYYKLDLTTFYNTEILSEERRQEVYSAMLSVDFSLTKEKAQEILNSAVFSSLIRFNGFSVKTQGVGDELAAIFTVNNNQIDALLALDYKVTYGGIIADADVDPADIVYNSTSDGVRVFYLFSNNDSVTTTPVFIKESESENQFGLSIFYDAVTAPEDYSKAYRFCSFAVIETKDTVLVAYLDASSEKIGASVSLYSTLDYLTELDAYHANEKMLSTMDRSFNQYNVYVDATKGSDSNNGSKNAPVKTVEKALEMALEIINSMAMPEVNINIAGGKYELDKTLTIDKSKVTADFYRLHFKAYEDEAPIITGTFEVPGSEFQPYDNNEGKNIYFYQLPSSMKDADGNYPLFNNLYVDGKMATLAESEWFPMRHDEYKTAGGYFTVWVPAELLAGVVEKDEDGNYKLVDKDLPDSMRWAVRMQWYYYDLVIESIDIETTNTVKEIPRLVEDSNGAYVVPDNPTMNPTEGYIALKFYGDHGRKFNTSHGSVDNLTGRQGIDYMAKLAGNMAFLDEGGEFYYDQEHGRFYYIPTEGQNVSELTFDIPTLETLIYIDGLHDIKFDGLLFTGTDTKYIPTYGFTGGQAGSQKRRIGGNIFIHEGAIIGKNVANITIKNCTFTDLYYLGVNFYGIVKDVTIDSCVFTNIGGGAIQFGATAVSQTDNNTNIRITNNYLDEIAIFYYNNCAITVLSVKHGKILQNSIIDCAYTGISVGWSWLQTTAPVGTYFNVYDCEIAYNYIENFMFMMYDGGSIYTLGGNAPKEYEGYLNELHHNYTYCGSKSGHVTVDHTSTALYHDGGSSHWYTYDNVTWVDQSKLCEWNYISIQGGSTTQAYNITAENNYFINLYQKYLTLGYLRVRDDWNVIESNSYLLTTLDPSEFNDTYISVNKVHTVSKNPANWAPFCQSGKLEIMNEIMAFSGCDLFGGIYKGEPLGDTAYDYNYRLLTQKETWYNPKRSNPNYADK